MSNKKDYKATLNLPQTDFPMKADLPKREPAMLGFWQDKDIYRLILNKPATKGSYVLHDGPPYANGDIHIGHALNKTLKDIIIKYKTMQGYSSPYVPGWDCHGLPVEHQLFKELKINKYQIQQVEFRRKAHDYALKYVSVQREQFKRLGVFGDWENPYLTLKPEYEEAIVSSLGELVKKGYIYRGLKPVNWCFKCETALAEAEVEYEDHASPSVYVKFEIIGLHNKISDIPKDKKIYAIVWTTTPWTLIANVAIAVNPTFRYVLIEVNDEIWLMQEDLVDSVLKTFGIQNYILKHYIVGKELEGWGYKDIFRPARRANFKFVLADYVSKEDGTGCVHTAPGHGQEDYLTGKRYNLETIMPVDRKGEFYQELAMEFKGQHVFEANKGIIEKLKQQGSLLYAGEITHSYPHCWRCKNPVIFRATEQWFLNIDHKESPQGLSLRQRLLEAIANDVSWIPASGKERISAMVSLRPDWCLSRQRYWGVPIPALICKSCGHEDLYPPVIECFRQFTSQEGTDCWFTRPVADFVQDNVTCAKCAKNDFEKGTDILDVWFDSGVSHQAVVKKRKELKGLPCELYLEGSDQHRGWFQSSLIPAMCIDGEPPFKSVLTHGFVVDGEGRKMSKSLGNVISPHSIIKEYGADILRLWVASSDYNEDIRISKEMLSRLSEAYRKIRNTIRFMLSNLYDFDPAKNKVDYNSLRKIDKWILWRLEYVRDCVETAYGTEANPNFEFYKAYKSIYEFCNEDLSMYYLDMVKGRLYTYAADSRERRAAQTTIFEVLNRLVRMIAPVLVFTAEEVWQSMPKDSIDRDIISVHLLAWPQTNPTFAQHDAVISINEELKPVFNLIPEIAKLLEELRSRGEIGSSFDARINLLTNNEKWSTFLPSLEEDLCEIFKVSQVSVKQDEPSAKGFTPSSIYPGVALQATRARGTKCERCWNFSEDVGTHPEHTSICSRCIAAIGGM